MLKKISLIRILVFIGLALGQINFVWVGQRLIISLEGAPRKALDEALADFKLKNDGAKAPDFLIKKVIPSGIKVEYAGAYRFTERDGRAKFALSHQAKKTVLVITLNCEPRKLSGNTIDHWALWDKQRPKNLSAAMFELEREKTVEGDWIWTITEKTVPEDGKIANTAIIIKADPASVVVPLGKVKVKQKDQVILPTIYLLDRTGIDQAILQDFGPEKLTNDQAVKFNLFQNLKSNVSRQVKGKLVVEVSSVSEEAV